MRTTEPTTADSMPLSRRRFTQSGIAGVAGLAAITTGVRTSAARLESAEVRHRLHETSDADRPPMFSISLAQWSLHRAIHSGELDPLDFAMTTRATYGIDAIEYVNGFFKDKATDVRYLAEMTRRANDAGVRQLLIMCDGEGRLGDPDAGARKKTVDNHRRWIDAALLLGCHAIRVNAASSGARDEQAKLAADGLRQLAEIGGRSGLSVIVENHGGLSSDGAWLADVMRRVDHPACGTLPDFGNFRVNADTTYDRQRGVAELMPFARAVSAKSWDFDDAGNETRMDYPALVQIVMNAGYRGFIGIEYEGGRMSEHDGILATKRLLERVRGKMMREAADRGKEDPHG